MFSEAIPRALYCFRFVAIREVQIAISDELLNDQRWKVTVSVQSDRPLRNSAKQKTASIRRQAINDWTSAHKDAVSLFERYANGGDDAKLKDWAGKTLPALKHHLDMAQALDENRK